MRVNEDDITMTDDYCYHFEGQPFTGIGVHAIDGRVISEISYRNGMRAGRARFYDAEEGYLKSCSSPSATGCLMWRWHAAIATIPTALSAKTRSAQ